MKDTKKYSLRHRKKDIEVLKAFLYKSYGGDCLSIHIYDKITKQVYAGNIYTSSWSREQILKPLEKEKP